MKKKLILPILATAFLGIFFMPSKVLALDDAASLECDGGTVSPGDPEAGVRDKCGDPQKVTQEDADSPIIWFYNFGPSVGSLRDAHCIFSIRNMAPQIM
jgi:hypothetical protein